MNGINLLCLVKEFLKEMKIPHSQSVKLFCDNQATLQFALNLEFYV